MAAGLALASRASGAELQPVVQFPAREFPLSAVRLLDGPFKQAMDTDKAFLLRLDADRLLAGYRSEPGLPAKAAPYGGWEGGRGRYSMAGHSLGHYLSALSMMAAASGDAECRRRANYIVSELAACQKAAGSGILCAFPESRQLFAEIAAGQIVSDHLFRLNDGYVPLYTIHKTMAGLRDAWLFLGNEPARDTLIRQADWLGTVFEKLSDDQVQQVLETEQGGIVEVAADVYALTSDPKYLALAKRLNHRKLFDPLVRGEDLLTRMHANAQIPKVIGMERLYELTGEKDYDRAARFFWNDVAETRSFVIGGHGANEFFFATNAFETEGINSTTGPETCNTYNMLKLSRRLWLAEPSGEVSDFIERALYNHILASQDPDHGGFAYFTSMRPGHYRVYCNDHSDFWCCTGTGMENHAKYGEFIYAHATNRLWVDLLIPSELNWEEQGVRVKLDTHFPEDGKATLTFTAREPRALALGVRCPGWLKPGAMKAAINGTPAKADAAPDSYAIFERTWKTGDRLEIEWPMALRTEMLPDSAQWISVLWGPVVLAGELGKAGLENLDFDNSRSYIANKRLPLDTAPVFTGPTSNIVSRIKPVAGKSLVFQTEGLASPSEVTLEPFYRVHFQRYAVYWKLAASQFPGGQSGNPIIEGSQSSQAPHPALSPSDGEWVAELSAVAKAVAEGRVRGYPKTEVRSWKLADSTSVR